MVTIASSMTEMVPSDSLVPHPDNPNIGDVDAIAESIRVNGFVGTIIAQTSTRRILGGRHTWEAAWQRMKMPEVPVQWIDCTDAEAERIMVALNRTRDLAVYDDTTLTQLLERLAADPDYGLDGTGYADDDLDALRFELDRDARGSGNNGDGDPGHGNVGQSAQTPLDRADAYGSSEIRSIILPMPLADYERLIADLTALRSDRGVETNSEIVAMLAAEAVGALGQ